MAQAQTGPPPPEGPADFTGVKTVALSCATPGTAAPFGFVAGQNAAFTLGAHAWALNAPNGSLTFKLSLQNLPGVALILRLGCGAADGDASCAVTVSGGGTKLVENFVVSGNGLTRASWYIAPTMLKVSDNAIVVALSGNAAPAPQALYYRPQAKSTEPLFVKVLLPYGSRAPAARRQPRRR